MSRLSLVAMSNVADTRTGGSVCELARSALAHGHELHLVGVGSLVGASALDLFGGRPSILMEAIQRIVRESTTRPHYILVTDAFDVIVQASPEAVLHKLAAIRDTAPAAAARRVLFSAETYCSGGWYNSFAHCRQFLNASQSLAGGAKVLCERKGWRMYSRMGFDRSVCWPGAHRARSTLTFPLQNCGLYIGEGRAILRVLAAYRAEWAAATRRATRTGRVLDETIEMSVFHELFARGIARPPLELAVDSGAALFQNMCCPAQTLDALVRVDRVSGGVARLPQGTLRNGSSTPAAFVHWPGKTAAKSVVYRRLLEAQHIARPLQCRGSIELHGANGTRVQGVAAAAFIAPCLGPIARSCSNAHERWGATGVAWTPSDQSQRKRTNHEGRRSIQSSMS